MLVESAVPNPDAFAGSAGARLDSSTAPSPSPVDFPYNVTPAIYPNPTYLASGANTSGVQVFSLSSTQSMFGLVNASSGSAGSALWFELGVYSASLAKGIFLNSCGGPCPSLPLSWSAPTRIANLSSPVTADVATSIGATVLVGATSAGSTQLYSSSTLGASWTSIGTAVSGTVRALSASPTELLLETSTSTSVSLVSDSLTGSSIASISESVSGSSTVGSASAAMVASSTGYTEAAAYSVTGTDEIELTTSTDGGLSFGKPSIVETYSSQGPTAILDQVGDTDLTPPDTTPGQVALATSPSGMLLAYTSENLSGATQLFTTFSANQGSTWTSPESAGSVVGTIQNLTLASSPAGLIYAVWRDPDAGSGGIDQATLMSNGYPVDAPTALPGLAQSGSMSPGAPSIAVDAFQRPLVAWSTASTNPTRGVFLSGGFLSSRRAVSLVDSIVDDPLVPANFATLTTQGAVTSFVANVTALTSTVSTDIDTSDLCAAQNLSTLELYANLTHVQLSISSSATVCAASLAPSDTASPIVSDLGIDAPNTYFATYLDWLLEAEAEPIPMSPLANLTAVPLFSSTAPTGTSGSASLLGSPEKVSISPSIYSPTSAELAVATNTLPANVSEHTTTDTFIPCVETGDSAQEVDFEGGTLSKTTTQVSVDSGATDTVATGTTSYPSTVWLTHLTPDATHSYTLKFSASYTGSSGFYEPTCPSNGDGDVKSWSGTMTADLSGTVTTTLSYSDGGALVRASFPAGGKNATISFSWGTTMPARASAFLNSTNTGTSFHSSTATYETSGSFGSWTESLNSTYSASLQVTSRPGTTPATQTPAYTEVSGLTSPAENATTACAFELSEPDFTIWGLPTVGLVNSASETATSALVEFGSSSPNVLGFVDVDGTVVRNVQGILNPNGNGTTVFPIELEGLEPWSYYGFSWGVTFGSGCVADSETLASSQLIQTAAEFPVWEQDLAYDSITQTGGGARIGWTVPQWFMDQSTVPTFVSGALLYRDVTSGEGTVVVPLTGLPATDPGGSSNFALNLTLPSVNSTYSIEVELNFSSPGSNATNATGSDSFVYELDSSGDGLTNLEKEEGWTVPVTALNEQTTVRHVTANPEKFSTNGLVGDYVEKELGLDPLALDTAGSGMLDTWNLTFNVAGVPAGYLTMFNIWNESSTYKPFAKTVDYAPGLAEKGSPRGSNLTNLTPAAGNGADGGIYSGDGSPWAAEVLWSASQLEDVLYPLLVDDQQFTAGVDSLRAVSGTYDGVPTLTVWGKLSWGANPLATSTSGTGTPDGAQVDPLGGTDVQVSVTDWVDTTKAGGDAVAAFVYANSSAVYYSPTEVGVNYYESAKVDYSAFTRQVTSNSGLSANYPNSSTEPKQFVVTFPVTDVEQYAYLNLSLIQNESTNDSSESVAAIASTTHYQVNLLNTALQTVDYPNATANPRIEFTYKVVPVFAKAPTWLLAPDNNTTLDSLPTGLARYTAEQDFDLLVLNDTSSIPITVNDVAGVSGAWTYNVTLLPGLNNLLVPRSMFLASPLGQTLINATEAVTIPSGHQDPSLTFNPDNWLPRVLNTTGNYRSTSFISVFANTTSYLGTSGAFGGVASNPGLEAGYESQQVQAVFWINVSSSGYGTGLTSGTAELTDLLGGLLLNNTGNLTGNLLNETAELPTLGLSSNVLAALANATYRNDGAYGTPVSHATPPSAPTPWWKVLATDIWNSVSGVIVVSSKLIASVWNGAIAATTYLADAGTALESRLGVTTLLSQTETALQGVGNLMWTALHELLALIFSLVQQALGVVVSPLLTALNGYAETLNASVTRLSGPGGHTVGNASAFWSGFEGSVFGIGLGVSVVVEIAVTLLIPIDLGPGFLAGAFLSLVVLGLTSVFPQISDTAGQLTIAAVRWVQASLANLSSVVPAVSDSVNWNSFAFAFSVAADTTTASLALTLIRDAADDEPLTLPVAILTMDFVTFGLDLSALSGSPYVIDAALITGAVGVSLGLTHALVATTPVTAQTVEVATLLAGLGLGAAWYQAKS